MSDAKKAETKAAADAEAKKADTEAKKAAAEAAANEAKFLDEAKVSNDKSEAAAAKAF